MCCRRENGSGVCLDLQAIDNVPGAKVEEDTETHHVLAENLYKPRRRVTHTHAHTRTHTHAHTRTHTHTHIHTRACTHTYTHTHTHTYTHAHTHTHTYTHAHTHIHTHTHTKPSAGCGVLDGSRRRLRGFPSIFSI